MITASKLQLKNGNSHRLSSVNIFIGPNNSGKSSLLRQLQSNDPKGVIVDKVEFRKEITFNRLKEMMDSLGAYQVPFIHGGVGTAENWNTAKSYITQPTQGGGLSVCGQKIYQREFSRNSMILDGETRLGILRNQTYQGAGHDPQNVFEKLHKDKTLKGVLQSHLQTVFKGQYFCLWNPTQGQLKAYLSKREPLNKVEYLSDSDATEFFKKAKPLDEFSDGVKAYIGILVSIIGEGKPTFFIDEPEAFLHPNLSYELGKTIAEICKTQGKTCFVATHSPQFVKGCLATYPESNSITRLEYTNGVSYSTSLNNSDILSMIKDPLLSNIGVTEALFHARVVIVEGDSDRAFYSEINNRLLRSGKGGISNCLFINAQNKQTIAKILSLLRGLGITCAAITDIDVFKEGGKVYANIENALENPGGRGTLEKQRANIDILLKKAIEVSTPPSMDDVAEIVAEVKGTGTGTPKDVLTKLQSRLRKKDYKKEGGVSLLKGQENKNAMYLINAHSHEGWFVIPNGELESWLTYLKVGARKDRWLSVMFEKMQSDPKHPDYVEPPEELNDVWIFMNNIENWFNNKNTKSP